MGKQRISPKEREIQSKKNSRVRSSDTGNKVIVLLLDTLRYDAMGFNNGWANTPYLDTLAQKGVVFDNAYLGSYPCMPARRDIWTGKFEFPFRGWGPLEYDDKDLGRVITRDKGITSMLITDHYHLFEEGAENYNRSFSGYESIRGQEYDNWKVWPDKSSEPLRTEKQGWHQPEEYLKKNKRNIEC